MLNQTPDPGETVQGVLPAETDHAVRAEERLAAQPASPFRVRESQAGTAVVGTPLKGRPFCRECGSAASMHAILNQLFCPTHGVLTHADWKE